jgi:hypothetical protein
MSPVRILRRGGRSVIPRPLRLANRALSRPVYLLWFAIFALGVWALLFGVWVFIGISVL